MKTRHRWLPALLLVLSTTACYRQVVDTGRAPGTTVVDRAFVPTFLFGLVAAQPIDVRQQCPSGVAIIQTEQSFLNGLASAVTFGIFTPQHVRVTCAASSASAPRGAGEFRVSDTATAEERREVVSRAVEQAIATDAPTVLRF